MAHAKIILTSEFEVPGGKNYSSFINYLTREGVLESKADLTQAETNELARIKSAIQKIEEEKYNDMDQTSEHKNTKELTEIEGEAQILIQNDVFSSVEKSEDFSNYISYMGRSHALSSKEKLSPDQQEQLEFMKGKAKEFKEKITKQVDVLNNEVVKDQSIMTGLFNSSKDDLTVAEEAEIKKQFSKAEKNGSILFKDVVSFDTADLIEAKIYNPETKELDRKKLIDAGRKMMEKMGSSEKMNETMLWTGMVHYNTNHFHIHFATVEMQNTRKMMTKKENGIEYQQPRGMRPQSTIDDMKSTFANEIFGRGEELARASDLRNKLVQDIKSQLSSTSTFEMKLMNEIREELPENKKNWTYGSKKLSDATREKIDKLTTSLMKDTPDYNNYLSLMKEESAARIKMYGDTKRADKDYFKNKEEEIKKRLGNSFLKELKVIEKNSTAAREKVVEAKLELNEEKQMSFEDKKEAALNKIKDHMKSEESKPDINQFEETKEKPVNLIFKLKGQELKENAKAKIEDRESNLMNYSKKNQEWLEKQLPTVSFVQSHQAWEKENLVPSKGVEPLIVKSPVFELDHEGIPTKRVIAFSEISLYDISQVEEKEMSLAEKKEGALSKINNHLQKENKNDGKVKFYDYGEFTGKTNLDRFSQKNTEWLKKQYKDVTYVHGEMDWLQNNRSVKNGSIPLLVNSPVYFVDDYDGVKKISGFKTVEVFDISQTEKLEMNSDGTFNQKEEKMNDFLEREQQKLRDRTITKKWKLSGSDEYKPYTVSKQFYSSPKAVNDIKAGLNDEYEKFKDLQEYERTQRLVEQAKREQGY
ncbi:MobP2 family relaxase [Carnobacterium maltaromaticum]|uniref:MobP2 family relaxase n=1 Tax=Carnobacterium maltaromaticum TaxID=2751 RepID=UPI00295E23A7|nr:MobP2 family relaxase [Carnobacterium maltaromaticum]